MGVIVATSSRLCVLADGMHIIVHIRGSGAVGLKTLHALLFLPNTSTPTGADENGRGQMAQIIQETLTVADSKNKTVGVASALGNALASMTGTAAESVANQTVQALNDLATDVACSTAASSAASECGSLWRGCCVGGRD